MLYGIKRIEFGGDYHQVTAVEFYPDVPAKLMQETLEHLKLIKPQPASEQVIPTSNGSAPSETSEEK